MRISKEKGGSGMLTVKEQQLLDALEPRAVEEGVEIVTVDVIGSRKSPTIRVYIDTPEGVSFDQLSSSQAWINEIMDRLDPFPGAYMLEVSSPGIDRPLRTPKHFSDHVGSKASIKTADPIEGRSSFIGTIVSADGDGATVACGETQVFIPYIQMKRAHLKGEIDFGS